MNNQVVSHNSEGCISNLYGGFRHEYNTKTCPNCGAGFCWSCCGGTNVHDGGKHDPDYMLCPSCGHDYHAPHQQVIDEADYKYSFARPALGETFRANHSTAAIGQGAIDILQSGEEVIELDTGWESGLRHFVVPRGSSSLELVDSGSPHRCDLVRFI